MIRHSQRHPVWGWLRLGSEAAALGTSLLLALAMLGALGLAASPGVGPIASGDSVLHGRADTLVTIAPATVAGATRGLAASLTLADADAIARTIGDARPMSRLVSSNGAAATVDAAPRATVEGVDAAYAQVLDATLARGAFFTNQDEAAANPVAVLGQGVAASLFPGGQAPIGAAIRIRNLPFTVVGVLSPEPYPATAKVDSTVFVPFQTGQVRLFGSRAVYDVVLQARDGNQASSIADQVQQLLRQRHGMISGRPDDFTIQTDSIVGPATRQAVLEVGLRSVDIALQYTCRAKNLCEQSQTRRPSSG